MDTNHIRGVLNKLIYFRGVYAADQLPDILIKIIKKYRNQPSAFIVNTHPAHGPGEHWLAFYITPRGQQIEFFDSFGYSKDLSFLHGIYFLKFIKNRYFKGGRIWSNIERLQDKKSILCGYYCCLFIYYRCLCKIKFDDVIQIFTTKKKNYKKNDLNIVNLFRQNLWRCNKLPHDPTLNLNQKNLSMLGCLKKIKMKNK